MLCRKTGIKEAANPGVGRFSLKELKRAERRKSVFGQEDLHFETGLPLLLGRAFLRITS